jgi:hypothetical protein
MANNAPSSGSRPVQPGIPRDTKEIPPQPAGRSALTPVLILVFSLTPSILGAQTTHIVTVGDFYFSPESVTIKVGDTVEWQNAAGGARHSVVALDGSFRSGTASEFTFFHTFEVPGVVRYYCDVLINFDVHQGRVKVLADLAPADLTLQKIEVTRGIYNEDDTMPVSVTVQNLGTGPSGEFPLRFYASLDSIIDGNDVELNLIPHSSLAAGESSTFAFNVNYRGLYPGTYYIGAAVEAYDMDDSNNSITDSSTVSIQRLELNSGLNDAWYDPDNPGQGVFVTVFPDIRKVFLAWFTYDLARPAASISATVGEPGHRWLTALGDISGNPLTLQVDSTGGGVFDAGMPVPRHQPYGTVELYFGGCNSAWIGYDLPFVGEAPRIGQVGGIFMERIATDNVELCKALQSP